MTSSYNVPWKPIVYSCSGVALLISVYGINLWRNQNERLSNISSLAISFEPRNLALKTIQHVLNQSKSKVKKAVLFGISGSGKSQLAKAFALDYQSHFFCSNRTLYLKKSIVWFLRADRIHEEFETLAEKIGIDCANLRKTATESGAFNRESFIKKLISEVNSRLKDYPGWLIIFDDVKNQADIEKFIPEDESLYGTVLLTGQSNLLLAEHQRIDLNRGMQSEEAVSLLRKLTGLDDDANARNLAEQLDYLPLALMVGGLYIKHQIAHRSSEGTSYTQYAQLHKEQKHSLERGQRAIYSQNFDERERGKDLTQQAAVELVLDKLSDNAKKFLTLCSLINKNYIPKKLLEVGNKILGNEILTELYQFSLLSRENNEQNCYFVHEVTQYVMRLKLTSLPNDLANTYYDFSITVLYGYTFEKQDALSLIETDRLRLHLQKLCENTAIVKFENQNIALLYVNLLVKLANDCRDIGRDDEDVKEIEPCVELYERSETVLKTIKSEGKSHLMARYETFLGFSACLIYLYRYNRSSSEYARRAFEYFKKAETCYKEVPEGEENYIYFAKTYLVYTLILGESESDKSLREIHQNKGINLNIEMLEKILKRLERENNNSNLDQIIKFKIRVYNNLGSVYQWSMNDCNKAIEQYELGLKVSRNHFPALPIQETLVGNLIEAYKKQKLSEKYDEAVELLKEQVAKYTRLLGKDHKRTKSAENDLEDFQKFKTSELSLNRKTSCVLL